MAVCFFMSQSTTMRTSTAPAASKSTNATRRSTRRASSMQPVELKRRGKRPFERAACAAASGQSLQVVFRLQRPCRRCFPWPGEPGV